MKYAILDDFGICALKKCPPIARSHPVFRVMIGQSLYVPGKILFKQSQTLTHRSHLAPSSPCHKGKTNTTTPPHRRTDAPHALTNVPKGPKCDSLGHRPRTIPNKNPALALRSTNPADPPSATPHQRRTGFPVRFPKPEPHTPTPAPGGHFAVQSGAL